MKNPALIFSSMILFAILGLFSLASGFLPVEIEPPADNNKNAIQSKKEILSNRFKRFETQILNSGNIKNLSDSINQINNIFEKNYLLALFDKRKKEYGNSFNRLYSLLPALPEYYPFYDELVFSTKATGNIQLIEKFIKESKTQGKYYYYLKALLSYNANKYSEAVEILKDKNDFEQLYLLSYSYRGLGDYENALKVMQEAESIIQKENIYFSKVLISKGSLFLLSGRYDDAESVYKKGFESAKLFSDKREEIKALINLAIIDDQNGNVDVAKQKLESALQISRVIENQELEATALSELAVSYTYSGDIVEAKNNYEESFKIFKVLNHKERLSNLCANIASLYSQMANYSVAIEFYNNGLEYAGDNVVSKILNLRGLGDVYANLSNYAKSLNYYKQAKELSESIKNIAAQVSVDVSIGTLYFNINKPIKALQIFIDAKNKLDADSDPYSAEDIYFKIGLAYSDIDSLEESNKFFSEALKTAQSVSDIYYETLISTEQAHNYYLQNEYAKAENHLTKYLNIAKANGFNQLLGLQNIYLGKVYSAHKQFSKSISLLKSAALLAEAEKDYNNVLDAEYQLGKIYAIQNDYQNAEIHYLKAINLTDKISETLIKNSEIQIAHFSGLNESYNELAKIYLAQQRNEDGFSIIERSRSRNTFQNLSNLQLNSAIIDKQSLSRFYDLKWMINSGLYDQNKLAGLEKEYSELAREIYKSNPELKSYLEKHKQIRLKEIQKNLNEDENLITLFFGKDKLYFFNITKEKMTVENSDLTWDEALNLLKNISPLYNSDYKINELYINQDLFSFNTKAANDFYFKVIKPAVKNIHADRKLIFSMPSELALVPLEFLVTEFKDDDSPYFYEDKKFLIEDYAVSYSPSASIYVLQKMLRQRNEDKVLLVGDPKISNKDFALSYRGGLLEDDSFNARNIVLFPLKYSKEEIQNLNSMFSNGLVLLSDNATEKNFKDNASQSSIIHLSTHSFLHKDQPLIIFSQDKNEKEDGYLESGEILQLKLNSDLVVLSSCRSGLGAVDEAEGVIGMQKSFFEAGAKSVVVSLWDVNDKYTSLFMQSFYKYLSEGFDKSEALRKAKMNFKKNYSANPYYWSAFVLAGDHSKIKNIQATSVNYFLFILPGIFLSIVVIYFANKRKRTAA
jgi:CHAT domain-containing protein